MSYALHAWYIDSLEQDPDVSYRVEISGPDRLYDSSSLCLWCGAVEMSNPYAGGLELFADSERVLNVHREDERAPIRTFNESGGSLASRIHVRKLLPVPEKLPDELDAAHLVAELPFVVIASDDFDHREIEFSGSSVANWLREVPVLDQLLVRADDFEAFE